jgi:hypothetical protein
VDSTEENTLKIDLEIRRLLLENEDVGITADQLLKKTESSAFAHEELQAIARFLVNANLQFTLFNFLTQQASNDSDDLEFFPWSHWFECLPLFSQEDQLELFNCFSIAIKNIENSNPQLYAKLNFELELLNPNKNETNLTEQKQKYLDHLKNAANETVEELKSQFFWLQSQELYSQAAETLKQLALLTSLSSEMLPELKKWTAQLNEKRAAELLTRKTRDLKKQGQLRLLQAKDKEEIIFLQKMANEVSQLAKTYPEMTSDFSVLLTTLENYSAAVDLLPNTDSLVWLKIEIMIHAQKNLEVLGLLLDLEKNLPETTENILAIGYTRALALKQLGKTKEAIAIMENIYHRYPDYRSASQLFREWNGDLYD